MMKKVVIQLRKFLFIFVTLLLAYGTMLREEVSAQTQQMSVKFENKIRPAGQIEDALACCGVPGHSLGRLPLFFILTLFWFPPAK